MFCRIVPEIYILDMQYEKKCLREEGFPNLSVSKDITHYLVLYFNCIIYSDRSLVSLGASISKKETKDTCLFLTWSWKPMYST